MAESARSPHPHTHWDGKSPSSWCYHLTQQRRRIRVRSCKVTSFPMHGFVGFHRPTHGGVVHAKFPGDGFHRIIAGEIGQRHAGARIAGIFRSIMRQGLRQRPPLNVLAPIATGRDVGGDDRAGCGRARPDPGGGAGRSAVLARRAAERRSHERSKGWVRWLLHREHSRAPDFNRFTFSPLTGTFL